MNIFIPEIGSQIKLIEPWIFFLSEESRNNSIFNALKEGNSSLRKFSIEEEHQGYKYNNSYKTQRNVFEMSLPVDTVLTIDRIYIRQQQANYSSVSFIINDTTQPYLLRAKESKKKKTCGRFWVKLNDANKIKCELIKNTQKIYNPTPII